MKLFILALLYSVVSVSAQDMSHHDANSWLSGDDDYDDDYHLGDYLDRTEDLQVEEYEAQIKLFYEDAEDPETMPKPEGADDVEADEGSYDDAVAGNAAAVEAEEGSYDDAAAGGEAAVEASEDADASEDVDSVEEADAVKEADEEVWQLSNVAIHSPSATEDSFGDMEDSFGGSFGSFYGSFASFASFASFGSVDGSFAGDDIALLLVADKEQSFSSAKSWSTATAVLGAGVGILIGAAALVVGSRQVLGRNSATTQPLLPKPCAVAV